MKIIKNLHFKHINDNSKNSILDISGKKHKQIIKEIENNENICLEIDKQYFKIITHLEGHDAQCDNCAMNVKCCEYISSSNRQCLIDYLIEQDYYSHVFRKIDYYELLFAGELNEAEIL